MVGIINKIFGYHMKKQKTILNDNDINDDDFFILYVFFFLLSFFVVLPEFTKYSSMSIMFITFRRLLISK